MGQSSCAVTEVKSLLVFCLCRAAINNLRGVNLVILVMGCFPAETVIERSYSVVLKSGIRFGKWLFTSAVE